MKVVWCVLWSSAHVVVEDCNPEFGHSIHRTRRGAEAEMRRMRRLARLPGNRDSSGRVTSSYRVTKHGLLP
jgi:hypothetical protein